MTQPQRKTQPKRKIQELSEDKLDAIASHAGLLGSVLELVDTDQVMYCLVEELERLQNVAIDELERRNLLLGVRADVEELLGD